MPGMAQKKTSHYDPFGKLFGTTRVRLLRLFLFNPRHLFEAEDAAARTQIPLKEAHAELRILCEATILRKSVGKKTRYGVDEKFPYLGSLQEMLLNAPLRGNEIYERVRPAGVVKLIVLSGIFAGDFESKLDVLIVGDRLRERKLKTAMKELDADIGKELRFASFATPDFLYRLTISDRFLRDIFDYPHRIVLDKLDMGLK
jgi:hypothetical protein